MRPRLRRLFLLATLMSAACGHGRHRLSTTDETLELERVVLYRNGVGYFERAGQVSGDVLSIKVRKDHVNDVLKSLTVIDRASGKALSVSMPLDPQSWANAALATLAPGQGSLAQVLDALRGTNVTLATTEGRVSGRIVMVERILNEPDPRSRRQPEDERGRRQERDHKVTLLRGDRLNVVRLSKVRGVTLRDGDLALQLHRSLDASAGEGMFQQVEVDIRLAGAKRHELVVSYVVPAPMWKPTYRVVLPDKGKGKALLQGWAVIDNISGEDWEDVELALTSGAPIAFAYDLHTPREVDRADLTEAGVRKRARVAMGETTYDFEDDEIAEEQAEPEPEPAARAAGAAGDMAKELEEGEVSKLESKRDKKAKKKRGRRSRPRAEDRWNAPKSPEPTEAPAVDQDALRRSTQASARATRISGLTRFDLGERVTVPDGTSTMVAIINRDVDAENTFLYRPGGAGVGYEANPYRVVRFRNTTPFVLEPGPISIYSGGSFVGEGLSEAVGTETSATIPYAVEPTILISSETKYAGDEMQLLRIVRGVLEVETFSQRTTTWTAKGKPEKSGYRVLIRHAKAGWNYHLDPRPPGTEDLADAYLVPLEVKPGKAEGKVEVVEQTPSKTTISIWDGRAVVLLESLLAVATLDASARKRLQPIVERRLEIGRIDTEIDGLKRQQVELDQRANETRQNLEAIKRDPAAGGLRRRLNKRLDEFTREGDRIGRKVVELQSKRLEKKIELEDLLQDFDLRAPPRTKKK